MIGWIVKTFLGGNTWILMLIAAVAISSGSMWAGYKMTDNAWKAAEAKAVLQAEKARTKLQEKLSATDKKLVEQRRRSQREYRELQTKISDSVDIDNCRIDDNGMQAIIDKIRSANDRRGHSSGVSPDPRTK